MICELAVCQAPAEALKHSLGFIGVKYQYQSRTNLSLFAACITGLRFRKTGSIHNKLPSQKRTSEGFIGASALPSSWGPSVFLHTALCCLDILIVCGVDVPSCRWEALCAAGGSLKKKSEIVHQEDVWMRMEKKRFPPENTQGCTLLHPG